MRTPIVAIAVSLLSLFASGHGSAQSLPLTRVDGIAAVVNEDVILITELQRATGNFLAQFAGKEQQLPPLPVLERQILDRLVVSRLQIERANEMGIRIGDVELEQAVQSVASNNRMSVDQLRQQIALDGTTFDQFRRDLRNEILIQRLRQRVVQSRVAVSDTEIDLALAARGEDRQVHLAHIQVALPDAATPEQIETASKKIDGIKALIDKGEMDFTAAAIRYSDAPNALQGGDLGWRGMSEIPNLFTRIVQTMKDGDISQPVRGPAGYQLIRLIESRETGRSTVTEYRARHMMIRTSEVVSSEQAKAKLDTLRARIAKGESFEKLARENSEDTATRDAGGDMGWFQQEAWGGGVAKQIVELEDGKVSPVFESEAGWHMIERTATRTQDVTEESRRNQVREVIARRKGEEEFERFLRQLRSEAFIDVRIKVS